MENVRFVKMGVRGFSCVACGKQLAPEDLVAACSDCGAIFCKPCVEAGELDRHVCDPEDL